MIKLKIVVVGKNSYLARDLDKFFETFESVIYISHLQIDSYYREILESDYVINFSISPLCYTESFNILESVDYKLANIVLQSKRDTKLVFISSRKVYGCSDELKIYNESCPITYYDYYSEFKYKLENELTSLLGTQLLILRVSNVIGGIERKISNRTFVNWIMDSFVNNGCLTINNSPLAIKDFITKDFFQLSLKELILNKKVGIYNISSGIPCAVGYVLAECVGVENLKIDCDILDIKEQFILESKKLYIDTGLKFEFEQLISTLRTINKELRNLK